MHYAAGVLFVAGFMWAAACTGQNVVFGNIPPATFQFKTVIDHDGHGPGGWRVAQVAVLLGRLSTLFPRAAVCDVEVGMPVANTEQGYIPEEMAQIESARAADRAAHELLAAHEKPTGTLCMAFRARMEYFLASDAAGTIFGAKVTSFRSWPGKKVPRRTFPPRRGR